MGALLGLKNKYETETLKNFLWANGPLVPEPVRNASH